MRVRGQASTMGAAGCTISVRYDSGSAWPLGEHSSACNQVMKHALTISVRSDSGSAWPLEGGKTAISCWKGVKGAP